jgi:hypothetical protein
VRINFNECNILIRAQALLVITLFYEVLVSVFANFNCLEKQVSVAFFNELYSLRIKTIV